MAYNQIGVTKLSGISSTVQFEHMWNYQAEALARKKENKHLNLFIHICKNLGCSQVAEK